MNTELNPSTSVNDPIQPPVESGVTRRSFVKRTAATILMTALAVNAFATEVVAANGGDSSPPKKYTILLTQCSPSQIIVTSFETFLGTQCKVKVLIDGLGALRLQVGKKNTMWTGTATVNAYYEELEGDVFGDPTWVTKYHVGPHQIAFTASIPDTHVPKMNINGGGGATNGDNSLRMGSQIMVPDPSIEIGGGTITINGLASLGAAGILNSGVQIPAFPLAFASDEHSRDTSANLAVGFSVVEDK